MRTDSIRNKAINSINNFIQSTGLDYPTQLEAWIAQACDPMLNPTPNLALNLEICDLINKKKKTLDAAFAIVKQVNLGAGHSSLALTLLDYCTKNCGYPFHLVISSKEFLNELVRRFPESPRQTSQTQKRILELIAEWNVIYGQESRYKDDFKHINDMYRLLEFKGYRFPEIKASTINQFEPEVKLKTEEQLEKEDQLNHGLKLEELIRKGTPAALAEANEMMKMMSGYDTSKKPDYKKEVNQEIERIESKVILLNDMLNQKTVQDFQKPDSTVEELYGSTKTAQNRLQKFIEENDDEDRLNRLLELNDLINIVVQKYSDLKSGKQVQKNSFDRSQVAQPAASEARGAINLIDFDDFSNNQQGPTAAFDPFSNTTAQVQAQAPAPAGGLLDEFSSLNFGTPQPSSFNQQSFGQQPLQGMQQNFQQPAFQMTQFAQPMMNQMQQQNPFGGPMQSFQPPQASLPKQQQAAFGNLQAMPSLQPMSGLHAQPIQPMANQQSKPVQPTSQQAQPFGDLFSLSTPAAKPVAQPMTQPIAQPAKPVQSTPQAGNDLLGFFGNTPAPQKQNIMSQPPVSKECKTEHIIFDKNGLQIKLKTTSPTTVPQLSAQAVFMNITPVPFSDFNFQVSLPKVFFINQTMQIQLAPASGTVLQPFNQAPVTQSMMISNPSKEQLRMRFRVQYNVNGANVTDMGDFTVA